MVEVNNKYADICSTPIFPSISEDDGRAESLRDADELHGMDEPPPVPAYNRRGRYDHCRSMRCISFDAVSLLPLLLLLLLDLVAVYFVTVPPYRAIYPEIQCVGGATFPLSE